MKRSPSHPSLVLLLSSLVLGGGLAGCGGSGDSDPIVSPFPVQVKISLPSATNVLADTIASVTPADGTLDTEQVNMDGFVVSTNEDISRVLTTVLRSLPEAAHAGQTVPLNTNTDEGSYVSLTDSYPAEDRGWISDSGTITVEEVSETGAKLKLTDVHMVPDSGVVDNAATGSFTLAGPFSISFVTPVELTKKRNALPARLRARTGR